MEYLEKYENYIVKICDVGEIEKVMEFFGCEWKRDHILATNKDYINSYFYDVKNNTYNFIIAKDLKDNSVLGMLGYVPNSKFDEKISQDDLFIWLTNWIVKKHTYNGIGLKLYSALTKHYNSKNIGTVGNNDMAGQIYKGMKYTTGKLKHYFVANERTIDFKIMLNYETSCKSAAKQVSSKTLTELTCIDNISIQPDYAPCKSIEFLKNKYANNGYYKYYFYGIKDATTILGLVIFRIQKYNGSSALRMVEYFGDRSALANMHAQFQQLMDKYNAEYLDFYCLGIDEEILHSSGFELNLGENNLVVPNYFEPLCENNITINFAYNLKKDFCVFKGDGDREHIVQDCKMGENNV